MSFFGLGSRFENSKTFRPKKTLPVGSKGLQLKRHIDATLGRGNLKDAIMVPEGEDENEWLAVNTTDFYNAISLFYGALEEFCTRETCATMNAGPKYEYLWADGVKYKKPTQMSAPQYMECLFDWVGSQLDDPKMFPQTFGEGFPPNFKEHVGTIFKRLFRVYGHIYHCHFRQVCDLGMQKHLNTSAKHFVLFALEYKLIDPKELAPLQDLIDKWLAGSS